MGNIPIVYIAGPYKGAGGHDISNYANIDNNINVARIAMIELVSVGIGVFCPHTHGAHFECWAPDAGSDYWLAIDLKILSICDALLRLPGKSHGADIEEDAAIDQGIPVYYDIRNVIKDLGAKRK